MEKKSHHFGIGSFCQIRIRPPGAKGRLDILKVHAGKVKMNASVDLTSYAQNLPGIRFRFLFF